MIYCFSSMDRAEYLKLPQQFHILLILNIEQ